MRRCGRVGTVIRYAAHAQIARAHLLRLYNDIFVFVEDTTCQSMHVRVLTNILNGVAKISHVFPLNGRDAVIAAAISDNDRNSRRFYVIDSDLDLLTGRTIPVCERLYRIRGYSIENLLLSEDGLIELALESAGDSDRESIISELKFVDEKQAIVRSLLPLFETYAVVFILGIPVETISYSVARICRFQGRSQILCPRKVSSRIRDVRRAIVSQVGWAKYKEEIRRVRNTARRVVDTSLLVSGKDYLLPLFHAVLRARFNFRDSFQALRVRLARHFHPDTEPGLRDFVRNAARDAFHLRQLS
jgi:hypothetical protein